MKKSLILGIAILVVVAAGVFFMMNRDSKSSAYEIKDGNFVISGSFGTTVKLSEITGLELTDKIPQITYKSNGSGLGSVFKGEFTLEGSVKARLYVDTSVPPFIKFVYNNITFYINSDTAQKTNELFEQLKSAVK
ncbi:MAG: hypothetical protein GYA50_05750 [Eubacteriaceae bacterium]|nr:hypothetical protein [Eubacteriaceae bacterium]